MVLADRFDFNSGSTAISTSTTTYFPSSSGREVLGGPRSAAFQLVSGAPGGSSTRTLDVTIETSADGTNWLAAITSFTQQTSSAVSEGKKIVDSADIMLKYWRAKAVSVVSGGAIYTPEVYAEFKY